MKECQKENQEPLQNDSKELPFLEWSFKVKEETGQLICDTIKLSDGHEPNEDSFNQALQRATGASDPKIGDRLLKKVSRGLVSDDMESRINETCALLSALEPKNALETLLLGQFLALNDCGVKCLRLANHPQQRFHCMEKFYLLANKLFNTANQTMQTVLKCRTGGQQTIQVVHMHNKGQAIVAQNLSPQSKKG